MRQAHNVGLVGTAAGTLKSFRNRYSKSTTIHKFARVQARGRSLFGICTDGNTGFPPGLERNSLEIVLCLLEAERQGERPGVCECI